MMNEYDYLTPSEKQALCDVYNGESHCDVTSHVLANTLFAIVQKQKQHGGKLLKLTATLSRAKSNHTLIKKTVLFNCVLHHDAIRMVKQVSTPPLMPAFD